MSGREAVVTVATRTALLAGSVVLMIQGHDWGSEVLSLMGLLGIIAFVVLTTDTSGDGAP